MADMKPDLLVRLDNRQTNKPDDCLPCDDILEIRLVWATGL